MPRHREKGFTLLELLVVVGIVGIIAAIAVMSYFMAIDRARQKRTVNDMRTIASAWEARATDMHTYAAAGYTFPTVPVTAGTLRGMLIPTYTNNFPLYDGWMHTYDYAVAADGKEYGVRSRGSDGVVDGASYPQGETDNPDCDIIYSNGSFVTYPSVAQTK
ncbi:MAG TPA: type II secretion system protein [Thermoanaerobaculia bacterium]|nr:type II secretion system protein [Thermoanaerobaculia bacterium]